MLQHTNPIAEKSTFEINNILNFGPAVTRTYVNLKPTQSYKMEQSLNLKLGGTIRALACYNPYRNFFKTSIKLSNPYKYFLKVVFNLVKFQIYYLNLSQKFLQKKSRYKLML